MIATLTLALLVALPAHGDEEHHEMPANLAPTISVTAKPTDAGAELTLTTTRFTFVEGKKEHVDGEGHAQIKIDGRDVADAFKPTYVLDAKALGLRAGKHAVIVYLVGNDFASYEADGKRVEAGTTIEVSEAAAATDATAQSSSDDGSAPWGLIGAGAGLAVVVAAGFLLGRGRRASSGS